MTDDLTASLAQLADAARPMRSVDLEPFSDLARGQLEEFRRTWDRLPAARRLELIAAMVEQAEANIRVDFHAVLRGCLHDDDARVRKLAVDGLWEDERPNLAPALVDLLDADPAAEVRAAAATSLGRFVLLGVLDEVSEELARLAEDALAAVWHRTGETIEVRRRALESLSYTSAAGIHDLIRAAYYHDNSLMRQSALLAMGRNADACWSKIILAELSSPEPAMRFEAAVAAGEMALRAAARPLAHALEDPDVQVREAAVSALGKIGGPIARRSLQALVGSPDEPLAEVASEALDELMFESDGLEDLMLGHAESGPGRRRIPAGDEDDWDETADLDAEEDGFDDDEDDFDDVEDDFNDEEDGLDFEEDDVDADEDDLDDDENDFDDDEDDPERDDEADGVKRFSR